jgi:hypothetical protein
MGNNIQKIPEKYNLTHFQNLKLNKPINAYHKDGKWINGILVSYLRSCKYENNNFVFYDILMIQTKKKDNKLGEIIKIEYPSIY